MTQQVILVQVAVSEYSFSPGLVRDTATLVGWECRTIVMLISDKTCQESHI